MATFFLFGHIIFSVLFFLNFVSLLKKIVKNKEANINILFGVLLSFLIAYSNIIIAGH
ncbi:hypothetical protein [Anaerosalibacter bizertensis]|uniref:hypothetical protein n=1 Tax=Anaerosalibacter bizertensis TaxID=932217 RepID=UPI0012B392B7|nr:hypothetical protein [Anaerosalibacter bizertensis]